MSLTLVKAFLFISVSPVLFCELSHDLYLHSITRDSSKVLGYYSGKEDAFDMRKALRRDVQKKSVIPLKKPITPDELEW